MRLRLSGIALAAIALFGNGMLAAESSAQSAAVEQQFRQWLANDIRPKAARLGVSDRTFNAALDGVSINWKLPDLVPPGTKPKTPKKQVQAEFGSPGAYFNSKTISALTSGGRARLNTYGRTLKAVEAKYGVPGHVVVAIWGRESGFGGVKIPHDAFEVLATKAFMSTRKEMFETELLAALQIVEKGYISASEMKSSWAGALGQPQFMPTSYLAHSADFDGDGHRDIWRSEADTLASIAKYLADFGWERGRDWGFEVNVPESVSCALEGPDRNRTIADWASMGITRVNGKPFPANELRGKGFLMMPAGRNGPAFVVTPNFYVIKSYNESDLYSLFIGHVGDRIAYGATGFSAPWGKVGGLYRSDVAAMQRALEAKGYDVGGADGLPGFKTRRSIGDWQAKNGLRPTCFPTRELVGKIR